VPLVPLVPLVPAVPPVLSVPLGPVVPLPVAAVEVVPVVVWVSVSLAPEVDAVSVPVADPTGPPASSAQLVGTPAHATDNRRRVEWRRACGVMSGLCMVSLPDLADPVAPVAGRSPFRPNLLGVVGP
jgi:hypothetical protein